MPVKLSSLSTIMQKSNKKITTIDLFSGCGGLSYGLNQAGFNIVLGIDNWKQSLETFKYNHPEAKTLCGDISKLTGKDIKKNYKTKN